MKPMTFLLFCCSLLLTAAQPLMAQNYSVPLRLNDGSGAGFDTLTFGVNVAATAGVDAGLGEEELPPAGPTGVFDARLAGPLMGQGTRLDLRPFVSGTQTDTFQIDFQSHTEAGMTGMRFNWDADISSKGGGGWKLVDVFGGSIINVNMNAQTSYTIPVNYYGAFGSAQPQTRASIFVIVTDAGAFRSFTPNEIASSVDAKGKQKLIKKKAWKSQCTFDFAVPAGEDPKYMGPVEKVLVKYGQVIEGHVSINNGWSVISGEGTKAVTYGGPPLKGGKLTIEVFGNKGKANKAKAEFNTTPLESKVTGALTNVILWNPFPNLWNMLNELYAIKPFTWNNGPVIGMDGKLKSVVHWKNEKSILKTLDKKGVRHKGTPRCLDVFDKNGKEILKVQKTLPPDKHNNVNVAEMLALKINIAASDGGATAAGYGDLVYVNPASPLDFMTIREIAEAGDHIMSCEDQAPATPAELYDVIHAVNAAFSAPLDTIDWDNVVTWTSVVSIADVPFLRRVWMAPPAVRPIVRVPEAVPSRFSLEQNYPNPFNPTTTIEFSVPEDAIVTLKVYNIAGQEVATLMDHEEALEGDNSVEFDATGMPTGIYYYRLIANEGRFSAVNKMILVK